MGKNRRRNENASAAPSPDRARSSGHLRTLVLVGGIAVVAGIVGWRFYSRGAERETVKNPTFAQDIAPLIYRHCAGCHHAGSSAPFALMSYADVSKRAAQIVKVTQRRIMPPWLPEHGYGDFEGERRLGDDEILLLANWFTQGAVEGNAAQAPAAPQFPDEWQLGTPDLVVPMPRVYTLPAEGLDVYRNFVLPVKITGDKYVKGIEFRAGTTRIHHAFIYIDRTPGARQMEAKQSEPGWPGMGHQVPTVEAPTAQFTSWQPGRIPHMHEDMAWKLSPGTDLVLQLHMQPGGKPEPIQASVALYFADRPGHIHPSIMLLRSLDLDIPPGEKAYTVRAQHTLAADVDVLAVLPHVHYLGKDLRGVATLPDGSRRWLVWIKDWDFNWQSDFAFREPVFLPKGSRVEMEYTFDNSAENPRNPGQPPKRVRYGAKSLDEMAEFWLQVLPHAAADAPILQQDLSKAGLANSVAVYEKKLRDNPSDAYAYLQLGKTVILQGQPAEAEKHIRNALKFDAENSEAHYVLGRLLRDRATDLKSVMECVSELDKAIQLDRENYAALNTLGLTLFQLGKPKEAEPFLIEGLRLQPNDSVMKANLADVQKALGKTK